jgi:hypothetical protein
MHAAAEERLGVAVARGLLLDLLATGDRAAGDAGGERYNAYRAALTPAHASETGVHVASEGERRLRAQTQELIKSPRGGFATHDRYCAVTFIAC